MNQLIPFDQAKGGHTPLLCLDNVRRGYGIGNLYGSAWIAWQHTEQHQSQPPAGLDVPLFYSYTTTIDGVTQNYGHINVRLKDGRVWSDGNIYQSIEAYTSAHAPKYVGWGESINGYRILEGEEMLDDTTLTKLWAGYADQFPAPQSFLDYWRGKDLSPCLDWLINQPIHLELVRKAREYDSLVDQVAAPNKGYELISEPVYRKKA